MENLVGQHDAVSAIKKIPVFVTTKVENEDGEERSNYVETTEPNLYIKSEEVDIQLEIDCESIKSIQEEYWASKVEGDFHTIDNLKQEGIDIDENQLDLKNEADFETEQTVLPSIPVAVLSSSPEGEHTLVQKNTLENITSTFQRHPRVSKYTQRQGKRKLPKKKSHKVLLKCEQCSFEAQCISKLHLHMRVHKDPSELDMYECTHCDFKTKYRGSLKQHSILHKDGADLPRYKCNFCDFETKRKYALGKHILLHQKPSGNLLKCKRCFYKCNNPSLMHSHMRVHKHQSELVMYECTQCNFKTKHRGSFAGHSMRHKDAADIPKYKCNSCHFESKTKGSLTRHMRLHQNTSGNVLKCEQCFYECNHPSLFRSHMRVHKDPLAIYKCTQCNFKTKYSGSLARHSILHKDAVDIPKYKCNSCHYFESRRKHSLVQHMRLHQKASGNVLKCDQCFYECNLPSLLRSHMRVHKDPSELDMYECTHCDFKTKYKSSLKQHSILHEDSASTQRRMYECTHCDFKTKYNSSLKQHSILHKDGADMPRYKCISCDFESKIKGALVKHMRCHQNTSGVLKCEQCIYECNNPSLLRSHMHVHKDPTELDMYECTQSNFKTKHKRSLREHFLETLSDKNTADIPQYKCNSCDFETERLSALTRHIRRNHAGFTT